MSTKNARRIDPSIPFDHAELTEQLHALAEQYSVAELGSLGTSVLDTGIPSVRVGHGRRRLLYVGGQRASDRISSALLVRFLWELAYAAETDACIGHLHYRTVFETHTVTVIPMLNPDGIDYSIHGIRKDNPLYERLIDMNGGSEDFSHWQGNARGVDLIRNYDIPAEGHSVASPTGNAPESEPEVYALCNLIRYREDLLGVFSLHDAPQKGIRYESIGVAPPRSNEIAKRLSSMTGYKIVTTEEECACGLTDWCIRERSIPAFSVTCARQESKEPPHALSLAYADLRTALFTFPILL